MYYPKDCDKCDLCVSNKFSPVRATGHADAKIMIVGEAPGAKEFRTGLTFVGPSGNLLHEVLSHYNLEPYVYITNTVKCYPILGRTPKQIEIDACFPYLLNEIKSLKPNIIVLLGSIAVNAFYGKDVFASMTKPCYTKIGKVYVFSGFHPSYILRNPDKVQQFKDCFAGVQMIFRKFNPFC